MTAAQETLILHDDRTNMKHLGNNNSKVINPFQQQLQVEQLKKNKVIVAREKLVNQVKKFKTRHKVGVVAATNNYSHRVTIKYNDYEDALDQGTTGLNCLEKPNQRRVFISESKESFFIVAQREMRLHVLLLIINNTITIDDNGKFLSRIKKYRQDYHRNTAAKTIDANPKPLKKANNKHDNKFLLENVIVPDPIKKKNTNSSSKKKKRKFMRRRSSRVIILEQPIDPNSLTTRRRKFISSFTSNNSKKRRQYYKKRRLSLIQVQAAADEQKRKRDELLQIRRQMMNFIIPSDWTCIANKRRKRSSKDNSYYYPCTSGSSIGGSGDIL
jgi:hypothetical protein